MVGWEGKAAKNQNETIAGRIQGWFALLLEHETFGFAFVLTDILPKPSETNDFLPDWPVFGSVSTFDC